MKFDTLELPDSTISSLVLITWSETHGRIISGFQNRNRTLDPQSSRSLVQRVSWCSRKAIRVCFYLILISEELVPGSAVGRSELVIVFPHRASSCYLSWSWQNMLCRWCSACNVICLVNPICTLPPRVHRFHIMAVAPQLLILGGEAC